MPSPAAEPSGHRDAVFGLAEQEGRILLVRNPRVDRGERLDCWDLPGGAVQSGETLPGALAREWREEVGLGVEVGELLFVVDGAKRDAVGALLYTWRAFVFCAHTAGDPQPGDGISDAAWVPSAEVPARLTAPYHEVLRAWLGGARERYAEITWTTPPSAQVTDATLPRSLLAIGATAAVGQRELLARELRAALAANTSPERIVETLLQVVPYAGYPRAITAFAELKRALPTAPAAREDKEDRAASATRGAAAFDAVYGATAPSVRAGLEALDPVLARWTLEHAYGRVLARDAHLTLHERELLAVAILTALGGLDDPLLGHMRACVRLGATPEQVAAVIDIVPASVGEGRRAAARALLERLTPAGDAGVTP